MSEATLSERSRAECTRDVVFLLKRRELQWLEMPEGYHGDDESELCYAIPDDLPAGFEDEHQDQWLDAEAVFKRGLTFCTSLGDIPCVLEDWKVEGVWLSREEAETYAKSKEYNYRHGWQVYGVCANGCLVDAIKASESAPALLEACKHVFAMIEVELYESAEDDQWHVAAKKLRAAIAAAE